MLKLSKQQLDKLGQIEAERFVTRMMDHARRFFGEQTRKLGDDELRKWVKDGISRADTHGFVTQRDLCHFLNLMFTFGRDFDAPGTEHTWATRILSDPEITDPTSRMRHLCTAAFRQLKEEAATEGDPKRGTP